MDDILSFRKIFFHLISKWVLIYFHSTKYAWRWYFQKDVDISSFNKISLIIIFPNGWWFIFNLQTYLTHWGRMTHIGIGILTIIASDNGLLPGQHQDIIWTNAGISLIGTNFSEILIKILTFSFEKMCSKVSSAKYWPFCLGLNVLKIIFPNEAWWYYTKLNESGEALYIP